MSARLLCLLVCTLLLAGCRTYESEWRGTTGSPEQPLTPAAAASAPQSAGNPNELRGCLSGTERDFTLVEANTATLYRLQTETPDPLKLNVGHLVALTGDRQQAPGAGAPGFVVHDVRSLSNTCPAAL